MTKSLKGLLGEVGVVQIIFGLTGLMGVNEARAEDTTPQMAKPFVQKRNQKRTAAPARKPVPTPTKAAPVEPTPEPTLAPEPTPTPQPQTRRSAPAARSAVTRSAPAPRASSASSGGAVDLSTLTTSDSSSSAPRGTSSSRMAKTTHSGSGVLPNFKFYFDFMLKYAPGMVSQPTVGFDSYHQVMMVEIAATPELSFITELSSSPRFFEVDYQASPKVTWRWGKIWIPFDDMSPHNIFGGRINTSKLFENSTDAPFLPDIWAELGVGAKIALTDSSAAATELNLYVTNGIGSGGTDPTGSGAAYPDFNKTGIAADNNNDKSYGARISGKFFQRASLGLSVYRGNWSDRHTPNKGLTLLGVDTQIRPSNAVEIRSGVLAGTVSLNPPSAKETYSKGGAYVETGVKFGEDQNTKFLVRAGVQQNDSRVRDHSDKKIVGATLLRRFGPIEASIQYSRDLQRMAGKDFYNYGAFRLVAAF